MKILRALYLPLCLVTLAPSHGVGQSTGGCGALQSAPQARCLTALQSVEIVQPRFGLAFTGGNPVPGTASTLGMRLGSLPRMALGGRITGVWTKMPDPRADAAESVSFLIPTFNLDATVGLFSGFSPAPTFGGVLSVDVLGSLGYAPVPRDDGFTNDNPASWALGARVGILRESFTVPGLSVSAMHRRMGEVAFGDPRLQDTPVSFTADLSAWSVRAAVSKRLFVLGATAGIGVDRYSGDVEVGVEGTAPGQPVGVVLNDYENTRTTAFLNASWSFIILHLSVEGGWQSGGDRIPGAVIGDVDPTSGAYYGSLALRLSI